MPENKGIERNYSPLWSVWRSEKNPRAGASSQSLLWNLYRRDETPDAKKCSLLFGLFQYQSGSKGKQMRLFYIPLGRDKGPGRRRGQRPARRSRTSGDAPDGLPEPLTDVSALTTYRTL